MPSLLAALAILASYLIGSIPIAYLLVRLMRGIDIRTVGSGNVGATNAGRLLGFRYFLLVFLLDMLKGFLPTWFLPPALPAGGLASSPWLPVLIASAAILGHNFPVYLRFRGGKGVSTTFGVVIALEPIASLAALASFPILLIVTRMVSLSSMLGGAVFVATHFARVDSPWSPANRPLSLASLALLALMIVRHRSNLVRIASGTETRVRLGRRRQTASPDPPSPSQEPRP